MNRYRRLQSILKPLKAEGLTSIKLNVCEAELLTEYERLSALDHASADEGCHSTDPVACSSNEITEPKKEDLSATKVRPVSNCDGGIELDPEIEALVAASWTDKPERAIATAAAYSVAGFATVVLWIALVCATLLISGLKSWHWCQSQIADLTLQLKYFESPFEFVKPLQLPTKLLVPIHPLLVH